MSKARGSIRFIEIGPSATLAGMAKRTLHLKLDLTLVKIKAIEKWRILWSEKVDHRKSNDYLYVRVLEKGIDIHAIDK